MATTLVFDHRRIEEELVRIQQQSAPTEARATILNLLVFADRTSRDQTEAALGVVLGKRAARIILVVNSDSAESSIAVSARCYLDPERRSVCLQEVIVENGMDQRGAAVNSWSPLLIRDIPVYAWWQLELNPEDRLLLSLRELADKVIVDSEASFAGEETLKRIVELHDSLSMAVSDFAWLRLKPLRLLTARAFDSDALQNRLRSLRRLSIVGAPPAFSRMYVGWLASRLGWRRESNTHFVGPGGTMAAEVPDVVATRDATSSLIVEFVFENGDPIRIHSSGSGTAVVEGGDLQADECAMGLPPTGELLMQNIDSAYSEFLYLDAVRSWLGES